MIPAYLLEQFPNFGLLTKAQSVPFVDYRKAKAQGIYLIFQDERLVYLGIGGGRAGIAGRLKHHRNKAYALFTNSRGNTNGTKDTEGWAVGRQSGWWNPESWQVYYFSVADTYNKNLLKKIESLLIEELQPFCNDETFKKRVSDNAKKEFQNGQ